MDINRISLIRESKLDDLKNEKYMNDLVIRMGLNYEIPYENPQVTCDNVGGLLMWQYPNQFSRYLVFLSKFDIASYIEIGTRTGGTFLCVSEYLRRLNGDMFKRSVAIDINPIPIQHLVEFYQVSSMSTEFDEIFKDSTFDLAFIDGDHSYEAVSSDFEKMKKKSKIIAIHDVYNDLCPAVTDFWCELKNKEFKEYDFYEFIEQYDDVVSRTGQRHMGIGVAVKRNGSVGI